MFRKRGIIPFVILSFFALSSFSPQEEQWTDFLGKPFDSVINALRSQYPYCDTHSVAYPTPTVLASCVPFDFLGEKGLLVLRRSKSGGIVKSCSWIRGEHPSIKAILESIDSASRAQLVVKVGDLDRIFNNLWDYYDSKMGASFISTDNGGYLWKPEQVKRRHIEYTMTRSIGHLEFTVTLNENYRPKKGAKSPPITRK
jgi:hypothetical protein